MATTPASAIVLAGGLSRRLGHDKRRLRLWGQGGPTLLEHTVAAVGAFSQDVVVVLNDAHSWPELPGRHVPDAYPDGGPLGAIATGLQTMAEEHGLVLACDMPLLSLPLLAAMLARPRDYDALVPRSPTPGAARSGLGLEPLHAIYGRGCLGPMRAALAAGRRGIAALLPQLRVAHLDPATIRLYDPDGHSFLNLNAPEDVREAERLIALRAPPPFTFLDDGLRKTLDPRAKG